MLGFYLDCPFQFKDMPTKKNLQPYTLYHKDGSLWAKGQTVDGVAEGHWEWFRKEGSKMRSGYFEKGEQAGEWTTYDKEGRVVKVTSMKMKKPAKKK